MVMGDNTLLNKKDGEQAFPTFAETIRESE
jgi:hypothetical protein